MSKTSDGNQRLQTVKLLVQPIRENVWKLLKSVSLEQMLINIQSGIVFTFKMKHGKNGVETVMLLEQLDKL